MKERDNRRKDKERERDVDKTGDEMITASPANNFVSAQT